jgi:hypothetical protein
MDEQRPESEVSDNIVRFQLPPKPGSTGRAGRKHPHLADRSTENALKKVRQRAEKLNTGSKPADESGTTELETQDEDFCQYIVAGFSIAGAYRQAYQPEDPHNPRIAVRAYEKVRKNISIIQRINCLLIEKRNTLVDEAERIRFLIRHRLEHEATTAHDGGTRLKALELLGKIPEVAAFEERRVNVSIDENSSPEKIKAELEQRLKRLGISPK